MNDNEKVIVQMILDRLQLGEGMIYSLWCLLHHRTQSKVESKITWDASRGNDKNNSLVDLSTESRKMRAVNAFRELLKQ